MHKVKMSGEKPENSEIQQEISKETESENFRPKSPFTTSSKKVTFNPAAAPFRPPSRIVNDYPTIKIGPSNLAVNEKIWKAVANNRVLPALPQPPARPVLSPHSIYVSPINLRSVSPLLHSPSYNSTFTVPPQFPEDYSRNMVFTRDFGPVAHRDGFVDLRLRDDINVLMTLDRTLLLQNPRGKVKIAVGANMMTSSLDHPNGKVYQQMDRIDIIAFDGSKKKSNRFVRYAKMWDKGISLTADGCALIYLVDSAGTRTTSDAVNKDILNDYSLQVFGSNCRLGAHYFNEADAAAKNYHFFTQDDGTQVFDILGFRVAQTQDGMVRITRSNNRLKIHTSPTNGSASLSTPDVHCTASLGQSSHLFVRREERRMHFDGATFVVRNAGHSSGFDEQNNLRVY